ncbi:MAG TPA: PD-(D/E)XK nuclease-like domain-containing protein [Bradyrhizobium sp.]|nr:PD-(D/E)XK nuclease-like domain-containing protein [Bradyrhizobium sp.]
MTLKHTDTTEQIPGLEIVSRPGIYTGITKAQYHGNGLTPTLSLSASGAKTIIGSCLKAFWAKSPLNPDYEREDKKEFDIGEATHVLLLEPHDFDAKIKVVYADSWRTNAAKAERESAYLGGLIPLLVSDREDVRAMRKAVHSDPVAGKLDFDDGLVEATMAWIDSETGVWLRCRPDFLPNHSRYMADLKTAASAKPADFAKAMKNLGYHQQAAWYLDAREAVTGEQTAKFHFPVVEKKAPSLTATYTVDNDAVQWGRKQNRSAIRLFADAMARDEWPSYRDPADPWTPKAFQVKLPKYALTELEQMQEAGVFAEPQD